MKVEQFLYHEARLLDTQQYEAWLELFTDDATYWVPLERDQKDPLETSSIIHDDRTLLGLRVKQARHPRAHARLPLARTVHQVGIPYHWGRKGLVTGDSGNELLSLVLDRNVHISEYKAATKASSRTTRSRVRMTY